jgi:hypothetical protein
MKTFKEYIKEHPNLRTRIIKAINPMDKLRDKMDDLKKLPGKVKDRAVDKLKDTMDKINPLSPINKKVTMMRKDKIGDLVDKKKDLTTKAKGIGVKIKSLRAKTAK